MDHFEARAADISCEGCAAAIQRALGRLAGVEKISVDVPTKIVSVDYDGSAVTPDRILAKLSNAGYDAVAV